MSSGEASSSGAAGPLNQLFAQLHQYAAQEEHAPLVEAPPADIEAGAPVVAVEATPTAEQIIESGLPWFSRWLQQLGPFLVLFAAAFLSHHFVGLFVFVWLTWVLHRANRALKQQLSLWGCSELGALVQLAAALLCNMGLVYLLFAPSKLWRRLLFLPTTAEEFGFWAAVFAVTTTDLMIKYACMVLKCSLLAALRHRDMLKSRRTQLFALVEACSLLYRTLAPVPVWVHYFALGDTTVVSSVSTALYLTLKMALSWERGKCLLMEGAATCNGALAYGVLVPLSSQMEDCSICQGELCSPVQLHCGHLYCEACVGEWLEREVSCPLCRASVRTNYLESPQLDGGTSLLPQVF
eukprot:TRINITY_DN8819_c0_g1_i2.p1 TRINITY_DN8819_c0_g1~~TRINITY_DN8819_c0_g1_i2.p1  ORF type:complete len:352 (-),score=113.16 TRINITY_DN8819_c0_g1_i2:224-1279(-)